MSRLHIMLAAAICCSLANGAVDMIHNERTVCEGESQEISCPMGYILRLDKALWGRMLVGADSPCAAMGGGVDVMCSATPNLNGSTTMMACTGKQSCTVVASDLKAGIPSGCNPSTSLYLQLNYTCIQKQYTALVCEGGGVLNLECPTGLFVQANSALFGRRMSDSLGMCPNTDMSQLGSIDCHGNFTTQLVNSYCEGKSSCYLESFQGLYGDGCPGYAKYLEVNYTCDECKNEWWSNGDCEYWALLGECNKNPNWMIANCRRSCTKCSDVTLPCVNEASNDYCDQHALRDQCAENPVFMQSYCRMSCNRCDRHTCTNNYWNRTQCEKWTSEAECESNPSFMLAECTSTCFECGDGSHNVRCRNKDGDTQCAKWAALNTSSALGECTANHGYMMSYCTQTCTECTDDFVCENALSPEDGDCAGWAASGECKTNPTYMFRNCWASCTKCEKVCRNNQTDVRCEYWRATGEVNKNPVYMAEQCYATTSRCKAPYDCTNTHANDTQCNIWAANLECFYNHAWMNTYCYKSCSGCSTPRPDFQVGNGAMMGEASDETRGRSYVLGGAVNVDEAKLTSWSVYWGSNEKTKLQVWRPDGSGDFSLLYDQLVTPQMAGYATTVPVARGECIMLRRGDRVGFSSRFSDTVSAVAVHSGMTEEQLYTRDIYNSNFSLVESRQLFSLSMTFITDEHCT